MSDLRRKRDLSAGPGPAGHPMPLFRPGRLPR